jgi:hypothetical protein
MDQPVHMEPGVSGYAPIDATPLWPVVHQKQHRYDLHDFSDKY